MTDKLQWKRETVAKAIAGGYQMLLGIIGPDLLTPGNTNASVSAFDTQQKAINAMRASFAEIENGLSLYEIENLNFSQQYQRLLEIFCNLTIEEKFQMRLNIENNPIVGSYRDFIVKLEDQFYLLDISDKEKYNILTRAIKSTPTLTNAWNIYNGSITDENRNYPILKLRLKEIMTNMAGGDVIAMAATTKPEGKQQQLPEGKNKPEEERTRCPIHGKHKWYECKIINEFVKQTKEDFKASKQK
jgi:hypothetical protein